jgi:hypothetical protein
MGTNTEEIRPSTTEGRFLINVGRRVRIVIMNFNQWSQVIFSEARSVPMSNKGLPVVTRKDINKRALPQRNE